MVITEEVFSSKWVHYSFFSRPHSLKPSEGYLFLLDSLIMQMGLVPILGDAYRLVHSVDWIVKHICLRHRVPLPAPSPFSLPSYYVSPLSFSSLFLHFVNSHVVPSTCYLIVDAVY